MNNKEDLLKKKDPRQHYSVPENYFENLSQQILNNLPESAAEAVPEVKKGRRLVMRSMKYAAAVLLLGAGIFLSLHLFVLDKKDPGALLFSSIQSYDPLYEAVDEEDAEYLEYLESTYSEALFEDELIQIGQEVNN